MITKIKFKAGPSQQTSPFEAEVAAVNVFVGPNNSGKSQVLREINTLNRVGYNVENKIIDSISYANLSKDVVLSILGISKVPPYINTSGGIRPTRSPNYNYSQSVDISGIFKPNPSTQENVIHPDASKELAAIYTLKLDGQTRLSLVDNVSIRSFDSPPENAIAKLFQDDPLREKARTIIYNAIGKYLTIDPNESGKLKIKFSKRLPNSVNEERGLTSEAIAFHKAAETMDVVSDGIKAFTGIITELIAGEPKIILIDEPEAFLHPSLAMKLGKEIGGLINAAHKHLFASTHSASFIMGCIQSRAPINIIRLTYKNGIGTTRILERDKLLHLMRNPMLRSTGIIEALFHEVVIVTEADADRAFYQEVNRVTIA